MLAILSTHPIQYQAPLWQALAKDGRVEFEVWYLTAHAVQRSHDPGFGADFAWDMDLLAGYPHRFLITSAGATPNTPFRMWIMESLSALFKENKVKVLWVQGWQVGAYWQAVWAAHKAGVQVWLRGESNALREQGGTTRRRDDKRRGPGGLKRAAKRLLLGQLFKRVDHFLCIGSANRDLYRSYGVPESKLHMTPYAVDNERFARQAKEIEDRRWEIRKQWGIPEESFCVLFCGKFIRKKRPFDLIKAAQLLLHSHPELKLHLLFVGSGELGAQLRANCNVVFDEEAKNLTSDLRHLTSGTKPKASFAGFLNQTEISRAYVAADLLVLPSDYGETWGLVVNEAMASGLLCIISDHCGCAPDLGRCDGNAVFRCGDVEQLSELLTTIAQPKGSKPCKLPSLRETADVAAALYTALT